MALYVVCIQNLIRRHVIMPSCHHAVKDSLILKADISAQSKPSQHDPSQSYFNQLLLLVFACLGKSIKEVYPEY